MKRGGTHEDATLRVGVLTHGDRESSPFGLTPILHDFVHHDYVPIWLSATDKKR